MQHRTGWILLLLLALASSFAVLVSASAPQPSAGAVRAAPAQPAAEAAAPIAAGESPAAVDAAADTAALPEPSGLAEALHKQQIEAENRNSITVSVVTWNMAEASPALSDMGFVSELGEKADLICLGVQEIENLKPRRHEGGRSR
jgi:hypothetical protein